MEAAKMQNLVDHEDEIYSRPARTWFQSEREKQAVKEGAKAAAEGRAPPSGSAQQQKAAKGDAKSKKREKLKEKRAAEAEAGKRDGGVLAETEEHTRRVKSIKSKTRELQLQGLPANKAAKIAAAAVTGTSAKKRPKKKAKTGGDLFTGDGLNKPGGGGGAAGSGAAGGAGGSGGARGGKAAGAKGAGKGLSRTELNRVKRGGKGKAAFKSKKRHKRR
ncbi:hypothetical protein MNEG_14810 [Monoraphidium neglectum]|uniref:Uncharacterized protein n=1 Tax=Monoraphidium neglectum TaxID=145388 RepID=A0A0D2LN13_9CHLO|nr:hypothetical protein MNEG_14810 [Monoraphidium neglectum]KIY93154.1 hypothetical protein MNEG_14810 [Monoraphidium neglectum]|eukprot:XP_013892174.1 hypothetical protein MNEG_14810 [Monoraphidium neglectum]